MISIQPFLFSSRLRLFVRGDMFLARACAADGPAQCRQDLPILIPEGWPTVAQRFNVGSAGLEVHKSRQGRLTPARSVSRPSGQSPSFSSRRCTRLLSGQPWFGRYEAGDHPLQSLQP